MFRIGILYPETIRNDVRNALKTVLIAIEQHTQARNSERSDDARGIVDTDIPRMTAQTLVIELVSVLYTCHSDMQLYRPSIVIEIAAITIDMIRTNHRFKKRVF
jgi:hypothetical protein